jgi:hypothetical protein
MGLQSIFPFVIGSGEEHSSQQKTHQIVNKRPMPRKYCPSTSLANGHHQFVAEMEKMKESGNNKNNNKFVHHQQQQKDRKHSMVINGGMNSLISNLFCHHFSWNS